MSESAAPNLAQTAKRHWWQALLLFFFAASGYLYVGRPARYLATMIYFAVLVALLFLLPGSWLSQPFVFLAACVLVMAVALFMIVDLIRLSVRQPDYTLRWYNRWWVYLGTVLLASLLTIVPELLGGSAAQSVRTFSIPSVSGVPALQVGDYIVVNNTAYRNAAPKRGDVAVFTPPRNRNTTWIKRIIGLPGDLVQLKDGMLYLNGTALKREAAGEFVWPDQPASAQFREHLPDGRSYLILDLGPTPGDNTGAITVPADHYFLLGDNRDNSTDSRHSPIGLVSRAQILGRATGIVYAEDFSRIGSPIK